MSNLAEAIGESYDLEPPIVERLEFSYKEYVGRIGNKRTVVLNDDKVVRGLIRASEDPAAPPRPLLIDDVCMKVRMKIGDKVEKDCSCDSTYMLSAMERVGAAIREKFSWIPADEKCYIIMDNAGGHGTDAAIEEYTQMLLTDFNIEIIHQVPRSPYTNLLDLGVWCSLQATVEKMHYQKRTDLEALVNSVYEAWDANSTGTGLSVVIGKVWNRLGNVLSLIFEGKGSNNLVEQKRGKRFRNLDMPPSFYRTTTEDATGETPDEPIAAPTTATNGHLTLDLTLDEEDSDDDSVLDEY